MNNFPQIKIESKSYINKYEFNLYKFTHPKGLFESKKKLLPLLCYSPLLNKFLYYISIKLIDKEIDLPKSLKSAVGLVYEGRISDKDGFEPQHLADLVSDGNRFITMRFLRIESDEIVAFFIPELETEEYISVGSTYPVVACYWAEQVELVLDTSRRWIHTIFESSDGIQFEINGNTIMGKRSSKPLMGARSITRVSGGWDHEHCKICHVSINEKGEHKSGYKDETGIWVCPDCYQNFVLQRSLKFITEDNA